MLMGDLSAIESAPIARKAHRDQKGVGPLELELRVESHGVGGGTQTPVHWKKSQC